jgi:hypothetical protein
MGEMQEKYNELPPEGAERIADTLKVQQREAFDTLTNYDKRIATHNFVTNGAGAVAILAYLGTGAESGYLLVSLSLFTVGVVSVGAQLRAMYSSWWALTADAGRRHRGFLNNQLTVKDAASSNPDNERAASISNIASWISQATFILGAILGGLGFFCPAQ